MTVTYTHEVANARLGGFSSLLLRWRGSVYKLFYKEFALYVILYTILSVCYRHLGDDEFKSYFEKLCLQFQKYTDLVPISFVLGFYVSVVVSRWWQQFRNIPWPDRTMMLITSNVHGTDNRGRLIRRTLVRYLSLAEVLTYRSISTAVFKRFPTMQHVIDAGFMTKAEFRQFDSIKTEQVKYFIPFVWFTNLLSKARQEGRIYDDMTLQAILREMNDYRSCCGTLFGYDWISIPLVYTQVVTVAVYLFFFSTLLSRQYLDVEKNYPGHELDLYVPIFTIFQFFFYFGWLKVAEQLINPFGEDDDDFEVNEIIDRNIEVTMIAVDQLYLTHPKLEKDIYWDVPNPSIPYTAASANHKVGAYLGSTIDMSLNKEQMQFLHMADNDGESGWHLDHNHNRAEEVLEASSQQPPSYNRVQRTPNQVFQGNPINFWLRNVSANDEAKETLLEDDAPASEGNLLKNDGFDSQLPDEDSADSDIGHGGGSEDDDTQDDEQKRRSSLSSLDGEEEIKEQSQNENGSQVILPIGKHSIGDPEDNPSAKKRKNSVFKHGVGSDFRPKTLPLKPKENFNGLKHNLSEGNLKYFGNRFPFGKTKKPHKGKPFNTMKRNSDFQLTLPVDEERQNAQMRTVGHQKNNKRKSIQALHRNARRANYPGNAWLRHRNTIPWSYDSRNGDYTSVTSGADDRPDFDSPFGSINSFTTAGPSPRPLRFSFLGKRGRRIHMDSVSSSGMTSPGGYDENGPPSFFSAAPKNRDDVPGAVSMPFTEDLRRRLLVVNSGNTPGSSQTASPVSIRANPPSYHQQVSRSSLSESDDLTTSMIPTGRVNVPGSGWENTLEAIGEMSSQEKAKLLLESAESKNPDETNNQSEPVKIDIPLIPSTSFGFSNTNCASATHTTVSRSKSCPNEPSSSYTVSVPITASAEATRNTYDSNSSSVASISSSSKEGLHFIDIHDSSAAPDICQQENVFSRESDYDQDVHTNETSKKGMMSDLQFNRKRRSWRGSTSDSISTSSSTEDSGEKIADNCYLSTAGMSSDTGFSDLQSESNFRNTNESSTTKTNDREYAGVISSPALSTKNAHSNFNSAGVQSDFSIYNEKTGKVDSPWMNTKSGDDKSAQSNGDVAITIV